MDMLSLRDELFFLSLARNLRLKMSRVVLFILILSLLKNDVKCGSLGKLTESQESLMPRTKDDLPTNSSQSNSTLFSQHEILSNSSKIRRDFAKNLTSMRAGKFFIPKFEFLAGLNLGGGLSHSDMASLANLAKISPPPSLPPPGLLNPFIAASYDPYPYVTTSYNVQQSISDLTQLLQLVKSHLENEINTRNHSVPMNDKFMDNFVIDVENEVDIVDDRKRKKDKIKMKNNKAKKKREEFELQEENEDENEISEDSPVEPVRRQPQRPVDREPPTPMTATTTESPQRETTTIAPNPADLKNQTQDGTKGYYGGQPQSIGNVQITYDLPQETYGPAFHVPGTPIWASGFPSQINGSPWHSPSFPSGSYGSPSVSYGLPSQTYGQPSITPASNPPSYVPPPQTSGLFPTSYNPPPHTSLQVPSSYGPPSQSNGPITQSYGPPSQFYGVPGQISNLETPNTVQSTQFPTQTRHIPEPSQFSNPTSNFNGLPNYAYPNYPPYFDNVSNDDFGSNSVASSRSWLSNFARSRNLRSEVKFPSSIKNVNGFVPN